MIVYWGACLCSIIFIEIGRRVKRKNNALVALFSAAPLIIISAIRYNVGTDYFSYIGIVERYKIGIDQNYEYLFEVICKIIVSLGLDSQWIMAVFAVMFCYTVFNQILEDSPYKSLSVFLLLGTTIFFTYLNTMRQMTGCAICFYSMRFVKSRELKKFLACIVLASGMHISCILFLSVYFMYGIRINVKKVVSSIVVLRLLLPFLIEGISFLLQNTKYSRYLSGKNDGFSFFFVINILIFLVTTIFLDKENFTNRLYYNCQFLMSVMAAFYDVFPLVSRVMWCFWLPQIILVPQFIKGIKNPYWRFLSMISVITLFFAYATYSIVVSGSHDVYPYYTIFDKNIY